MKIHSQLKRYRTNQVLFFTYKYFLRIVSALILAHFLFFIIQSIILLKDINTILTVLDSFIFAYFIYKLIQNITPLFQSEWTKTIQQTFSSNNDKDKDRINNLLDIELKKDPSELELLYYNTHIANIKLAREEKLPNIMLVSYALIIVLFIFLNFMSDSFLRLNSSLFKSNDIKDFQITFNKNKILTLVDSTNTIMFQHNIPDITSIRLIQQNNQSNIIERYLNKDQNSFQFKSIYPDSGSLILEFESAYNGTISSKKLKYNVIKPFRIISHSLFTDFPRYTRQKRKKVTNRKDISLLKGSKLFWEVKLSKPYNYIHSNFKQKDSLYTIFNKRIYREDTFKLDAKDNDSLTLTFESDPIQIIQDEKPVIVLKQPQGNTNIAEINQLDFFLTGFDDYGFSRIELEYYTYNSTINFKTPLTKQSVLSNQPKVFQKVISWDITKLNLFPGNDIYYRFIGWDNDGISGYKSDTTAFLKIHLLSMEEVFALMNKKQDEIRNEITKNISERQETLKKLEQINKKFNQKKSLSFQEKQDIKKLIKKLEDLNKKAQESSRKLSKLKQEAQEKNLLSDKTKQQFNELQKLLEGLKLPKKQADKANKSLKENKDVKKSLDDLIKAEKDVQEEMDRAKALLEKLKEAQKNEQLVKEIEETIQEQKKITKSSSDKEQMRLAKKIDEMKKRASKSPVEKSMQKKLSQKKISEKMKQSTSSKNAKKDREKISSDLEEVKKDLQEKIKKEQEKQKQKQLEKMTETMDQLLYLSFSQEDLSKSAKNMSVYSSEFRSMISTQNVIKEQIQYVINQLTNLSKQTFLFNPAILKSLNSSLQNSDQSISHLEQRRNSQASQKQTDVLSELNRSLLLLQQNKNSMQNAKSGLGEQEFMQQMKKMAGKQQGINSQTQSIWDMLKQQQKSGGKQQGLSKGQKKQLDKNGKEQSNLSKELSDMMDQLESGKSGANGRTSEMIKEMKEIAKKLSDKKITKNLIERQKKLLKKMLNAANSGKKKDEEDSKREKESAKEFTIKSIKELDKDFGETENELMKQYEKILKQSTSPQLKELIKNYYENLMDSIRFKKSSGVENFNNSP